MAFSRAHRRVSSASVLKRVLACLVLLALILLVSVKFWFGPAYVEMRIKETLADFWSGPLRVGRIKFDYNGVMLVSDIIFCDQAQTTVMTSEGVELVLGNWPSLKAPARIINVRHLDVRLRADDGKLNLPLRTGQKTGTGQKTQTAPPSLERMDINSITLTIENGKSQAVFDRLSAAVSKVRGLYNLNIGNNGVNNAYQLKIGGVLDLANGSADVKLKFAQKTTQQEMRFFLSAVQVQQDWDCFGDVNAEMRVQGRFSDAESLWPTGTVKFNDWTILKNQKILCSNTASVLNIANRRLDFKKLSGRTCGGFFKGSFYLNIKKPKPVIYGGKAQFYGISMAELTNMAQTARKLTKGTGLLRIKFNGDTNSPDDFRANGTALVDDADLWQIPVIGELFNIVGAGQYKFAGLSDAEMKFKLHGPRMILDEGRLTNNLSAIEAERGGKVNIKSEQIDMFVVAVPLKDLEKILNEIPVVNWFMHFKNKIIRLRLRGKWSQPPSELISKQPVRDVKQATIGFFVDVAKSGGDIAGLLKKSLGLEQDANSP